MALLAGFLLHEGFPRPLLVCLAVAFVGAALAGASSGGGDTALVGVLLCLAAAAGHAVGVIFQKPALSHASPLQVTAYASTIGAIACLPFAGQLVTDLGNASAGSWAGVVYLGLLPTALAFWTWSYALAHMPAGRLGAVTYIVPAITVVLAWPTLGEFPPGLALAGGALCLLGIGISRRTPRTAPGPTPSPTTSATASPAPQPAFAESGSVGDARGGDSRRLRTGAGTGLTTRGREIAGRETDWVGRREDVLAAPEGPRPDGLDFRRRGGASQPACRRSVEERWVSGSRRPRCSRSVAPVYAVR